MEPSGTISRFDQANGSNSSIASSYSMFPIVEKTYRVRITEEIERELRYLGQSRFDAFISRYEMTLVKDKHSLQIYELCEKELYTMKGVTKMKASLQQVMRLLCMDTSTLMRDTMGKIFGTLFLDGAVLYKAKEDTLKAHETMSVNWMALQSTRPNLPHRDYVFLRYGDIVEKMKEYDHLYSCNSSGLAVGASVWETIQIDGCAPLPASQNVVRLMLRRCGIVVEELDDQGSLQISLYISEPHPGRAAVSSLTKSWMSKMVSCVKEIPNTLLAGALVSQTILTREQLDKDGDFCCFCRKSFTILRRKHHCRICGDVFCGKCSEMKNLRQGGIFRVLRICITCRKNTSVIAKTMEEPSELQKQSISSSNCSSASSRRSSLRSDNSISKEQSTKNKSSIDTQELEQDIVTYNAPVKAKDDEWNFAEKNPSSTSLGDNSMPLLLHKAKRLITDHTESLTSTGTELGLYSIDSAFSFTEDELVAIESASTIRENTQYTYALNYNSHQDWPVAPIPANEKERLKKVHELYLVDTNQHFHEVCEYAALETGCKYATLCLIGNKSGFLMARVGTDKQEVPRNVLLDSHTIMSEDPLIILDATTDPRFANNPSVLNGNVRFYAGFPLITSDGFIVGSLSIGDEQSRTQLAGDKYLLLKSLAEVAIRGIEQNTAHQNAIELCSEQSSEQIPMPPEMNMMEAHLTMQELLRTAYTTQCQVRMQVNTVSK